MIKFPDTRPFNKVYTYEEAIKLFKPGDKFEISIPCQVLTPADPHPDGTRKLENGDILEMVGIQESDTGYPYGPGTWCLYYKLDAGGLGGVNCYFIKLYEENTGIAICHCNIMISGCTCGAMEKERSAGNFYS